MLRLFTQKYTVHPDNLLHIHIFRVYQDISTKLLSRFCDMCVSGYVAIVLYVRLFCWIFLM